MTDYREILRLNSLGLSERNIAKSVGCSRNTVSKAMKRAAELNLCWPLEFSQTNATLAKLFYPREVNKPKAKRMPDFNSIHKELMKNGVRKNCSGQNIWRSVA